MQQKHHQQLTSSLTSICTSLNNKLLAKQLTSILSTRKKLIQTNLSQITSASRPYQITESYNKQIIQHCNQYSGIKKFVQDFSRNPAYFRQITQLSNGFWEVNEKTQRQLEKKLKTLKQIDAIIDQLIEKEIGMANQIQDIEEVIRGILGKKEYDHINKAQPLYIKKENIFLKLQEIKKEKQVMKQQKLFQLNKILDILHNMKLLRKKRLQQCKHTNFSKQSINLIQCFMKDIQQIIQNKKISQIHETNQKKMFLLINESNQKINKLSKQLVEMFDTQIKTFNEINQIFKAKSEISYFSEKMIAYFDVPEQEILSINEAVGRFLEAEAQKNTQLNQIHQGINTTEDTIQIFQNLKHNIQTQTLRKKQLIQKINKLNKSHFVQKQRRQTISIKQTQIQSLKLNVSKLQTQLQQAAQQADVKQYKIVHSHLEQLSRGIRQEYNELQKLKNQKRQATKRIYSETTSIQQEYKDLISEMFPQIWFRDNDFSKEETIADFQVYLGKLFSRLRILA